MIATVDNNIYLSDENGFIRIYNLPNNKLRELRQNNQIKLTPREKEVLKLIVDGESNTEIAEKLFISVHTAKAHVCNILHKMGVTDRVKAAVIAVKTDLV